MKCKILVIVTVALLVVSVLLSVLVLINTAGISDKNNDSGTQEELKVIKRIYCLDVQYENEAKEAESDEDLAELNETYANLWKSKADRYLEKLKEYYGEDINNHAYGDYYSEEQKADMLKKLIASQKDWDEYYENQTSFYKKYLETNHEADTDYSVEYYKYSMNLCRDRAIELYNMCNTLFIVVFPL